MSLRNTSTLIRVADLRVQISLAIGWGKAQTKKSSERTILLTNATVGRSLKRESLVSRNVSSGVDRSIISDCALFPTT